VGPPVLTRCVLLLVLLAVPACHGGATASPESGVPMRRLAAPAGHLFGTAWLPDGRIYFGHATDAGAQPETWRIPASGGGAEQLALPSVPTCRFTEFLHVTGLPDGRLGLTRVCHGSSPDRDAIDTGALDPRTGRYEPLAPLGDTNPSAVTWRKDLRAGFVSYSSAICAGLAAITRKGPRRVAAPVTLDGRTWHLDEDVFAPGDTDCTGRGRADLPVLSPDGRLLYFVASPASVGVSGTARLDVPWNLYRWPEPAGRPEPLLRDLGTPVGLAISPDGRQLAVCGQRGGQYGLWLVDSSTGSSRKLADGKLVDPSFSPDGRHLAAIFRQDGDHAFLQVLDLPRG
jgi:WD40-like Beta Propeller Repeat